MTETPKLSIKTWKWSGDFYRDHCNLGFPSANDSKPKGWIHNTYNKVISSSLNHFSWSSTSMQSRRRFLYFSVVGSNFHRVYITLHYMLHAYCSFSTKRTNDAISSSTWILTHFLEPRQENNEVGKSYSCNQKLCRVIRDMRLVASHQAS